MLPPTDAPNSDARHDAVRRELSVSMGEVNAGLIRLLEAVEVVLDEGHHVGVGLRSPAHFLAWRTGMSLSRCGELVVVAKRRADLPVLYAAVKAGELTIDQAAVVARHVPAEYDASVTEFARHATVAQLIAALPSYGFDKPKAAPRTGIATGTDDQGWWIRGRASAENGALIDQALESTRSDLRKARRKDLPKGEDPAPVTTEDALVSLAEAGLQRGEAARPGSDRYKVHVHLEQGANGDLALSTTIGSPLPAAFRRHLLCDGIIAALIETGASELSVGRTTRTISRKLRRAILRRDRGCRIPGCGATTALEVHHIVHWEDGGPTDVANLVTLCWHHHHLHHDGRLHITGTAHHLHLTDRAGRHLHPVGTNHPPTPPTSATPYQNPFGDRLDPSAIHFNPAPPADPLPDPPPDVIPRPPARTEVRELQPA